MLRITEIVFSALGPEAHGFEQEHNFVLWSR